MTIDCLLVHSNREALAITKNDLIAVESFFVPTPAISTGAGDHFNAGYNAGKLLGLDLKSCLLLGHGVSGHYVRFANSPSLAHVIAFLDEIHP
jgi:sugar/nucleoside kinase (ribokinase family)